MTLPPRLPALDTPLSWRRILVGYYWRDHAFVRAIYPNWHRVDADLYRSAHPNRRQLRRARDLGVKSILSLRGDAENTPNLLERRAAEALGLDLRAIPLRAHALPPRRMLLALVEHLRDMPKPMLVHCKSGSDRTGLAVTLYLHLIQGKPLPHARRALSWVYGHWSFGSAGVVHRLLDAYAAAHAATGIAFEDWVRDAYDPAALMATDRG